MDRRRSGQSLVEFAVTLCSASGVLLAGAYLMRSEWQRARCAYQVFEATHARLVSSTSRLSLLAEVEFEEGLENGRGYLKGKGKCGVLHETVQLPTLE